MNSNPPMAVCPSDLTPLIPTFERRGKEWHCMTCGDWSTFFSPSKAPPSPELDEQYAALLARFRAGERGPLAPSS